MIDQALREQLVPILDWEEVRIAFEKAIENLHDAKRASVPPIIPAPIIPTFMFILLSVGLVPCHDRCQRETRKAMMCWAVSALLPGQLPEPVIEAGRLGARLAS